MIPMYQNFQVLYWILLGFFACLFILQSVVIMLTGFRRPNLRQSYPHLACEILLLLQILAMTMVVARIFAANRLGFLVDGGFVWLRYGVLALLLLTIALTADLRRSALLILTVFCLIFTLPFMEKFPVFPLFFTASLLLLLVRAVSLVPAYVRRLREEISAISVRDALNTLPTGVLYYDAEGKIFLINRKMDSLLSDLTGRHFRNASQMMAALQEPTQNYREENIYTSTDNSSYLFLNQLLTVKKKSLYQLTASDITEQWQLTKELEAQYEILDERHAELKSTLQRILAYSHNQALQQAKARTHDILGEFITILLNDLRGERRVEPQLLREKALALQLDLRYGRNAALAKEELASLVQTFESIGVKISVQGELPKEEDIAHELVMILREACGNAVRHGLAQNIYCELRSDDHYRMRIGNDGALPSLPLAEGGGLNTIRDRLQALGGSLETENTLLFTLLISLPRSAREET